MTAILDIETAIIDRLKDQVSELLVIGFPESPAGYILTHPKGAVLVSYQGSSFSEPKSNFVSQIRRIEFDITLVVRNLRNHDGAYGYMDIIRTALTGYRVLDVARLYPTREGFLSEQSGMWQYGMSFAMNAVWEEE